METFIDKLSRKQKKILNYFLEHPTEEIHLRGLAKKTGVSHTWIKKAVDEFQKHELVNIREGHDYTTKANRENPLFKDIKRSHNHMKLHELTEFLDRKYRPNAIVVFGSYAKGEDTERSDIDIAIITPEKIEPAVQRFEKVLGKTISIKVIDRPKGEFKTSLKNGVILRGYLE